MIQIKKLNNTYVEFYPILSTDLTGECDTITNKKLVELPEHVYGKYVGGISGYQPWWVYVTINKSLLREI